MATRMLDLSDFLAVNGAEERGAPVAEHCGFARRDGERHSEAARGSWRLRAAAGFPNSRFSPPQLHATRSSESQQEDWTRTFVRGAQVTAPAVTGRSSGHDSDDRSASRTGDSPATGTVEQSADCFGAVRTRATTHSRHMEGASLRREAFTRSERPVRRPRGAPARCPARTKTTSDACDCVLDKVALGGHFIRCAIHSSRQC
jgi:hypothetical protein